MMSFSLSGGVEVFGFISPSEPTDTYPVIDPIYGIDGLRNVDTISDLDNISNLRRRAGMVVGVSGGTEYYKLNPSPWNFDFTDWSVFFNVPITGATSVGTGLTIFDSVVDRTIQINTITGDTLGKIVTTTTNNTIQVGINEENLSLWPLVVQGNRLLSGGVSYVSGLTFNVSPVQYIIDGSIYEIQSPTTVILNSGDTLYDRIDVIVADISGNTSVVQGVPSANPEKPDIDESIEVEVTFVIVRANSVTADIDGFVIYNENLGPPTEWTFGAGGTQSSRIIGSSTGQTYSGTTSIRVSGVTASNYKTYFRLTGNTEVDTNNYATLQFALKNLSANTTTNRIRIRFLTTGGTQNGSVVYMNAQGTSGYVQYSSTNTSTWQLISIPLWRFYLTNTNVQVVEIAFYPLNGSVTSNYYFDLIEFVEGTSSSPPSNSWTKIKGDSATTIIAPNPNATLTISGGTNISSSISGSSTVVLNLDNNISLNSVSATTISGGTFYGNGSLLTGITSLVNYSNVAFVDAVNGNNTTATINDFTKPFTTIPLAISALVTAGQTNRGLVYVRRGTYNNNIVNLVDGIDVYCEPGVILGGDSRVRDNSVDVTSNFFGYAKILNTSNVAVLDIKGNSFVTFEFDEIICNGAAFEVNTPTTNNKVLIKGNNIFASTLGFGYGSTIRGASNVVVRIAGDINSVHQVIRFRFFTGSAEIYANRILLRDGNIYGGAWDQCLYIDNASSTGNITIKSDLISQKSTYGGSTDAMVRFWDNPNANVQIYGNIITIINEGVIMSSGNSKLTFSGVIKGSRTMFSVNGSSVVNIKDSTIIRSGSTVAGPINITNSGLAYINDTTMYSEFLDGNIINIESNTASLFIKDMVAQGVGINYFVNVGTATPTVGLINAVSNKDNHPSFVNAYTVAGSFYLEPNLNVPKFI